MYVLVSTLRMRLLLCFCDLMAPNLLLNLIRLAIYLFGSVDVSFYCHIGEARRLLCFGKSSIDTLFGKL